MLNVVIFVKSVVHRSNWRSRETETVGNSRKQSETVGNSRKQSETVGNSRKQSGAARRDHAKIVNPPFFLQKKTFRAIPFFFESATGNSWKQLGLVPLTRQNTSYLKPFKVHFLCKLVSNSSFFAESKVRAPTVSNCFPLHFQKKMGLRGKFFFAKKMAD